MSIRTLLEINHDFWGMIADHPEAFAAALNRYLASASREDAEALERYGVKVIGLRHHSGSYYVEGDREPDGFPLKLFPSPPPAPQLVKPRPPQRGGRPHDR
jgi:hypothetical protein